LTAGDAEADDFLALVQGGVGLLEIGIPFSDPVADGPVIQQAMARALKKKTALADALKIVAEVRKKTEVPIVLFTYYNPVQRDLRKFLAEAKRAGADGVLIVDLPLEEADRYRRLCSEIGLDPIFVVAPSTPKERMAELCRAGRGFIYYACRKGTTGARDALPEDFKEKIEEIRNFTDLPIAVGFGIADRASALAVLEEADGVVIGSYFVQGIVNGDLTERVKRCCSN
jgi:tryptophan synthase alpha chain